MGAKKPETVFNAFCTGNDGLRLSPPTVPIVEQSKHWTKNPFCGGWTPPALPHCSRCNGDCPSARIGRFLHPRCDSLGHMTCARCAPYPGASQALYRCDTPWEWANLLVHLAQADERELSVRLMAQAFANGSRKTQLAAIQCWTQQNVTYKRDSPPAKLAKWLRKMGAALPGQPFEVFDRPSDVLARGWGDCDDSARLVRALGRALGHPVRLIFMGRPGEPEHVVAALTEPGRPPWWLEATIPAYPGEHPVAARRRLNG